MVRRLTAAVAVAALALVAGCGGGDPPSTPAPAASGGPTFTNPVFDENFPDPGVISAAGTWYAYGTNSPSANVPVLTSPDMITWAPQGDAMPEVGSWATKGHTWAPEVVAAAGGYLLYYTARSTATNRQCIGVAFASAPGGPFVDESDEPLICQADEGGSIDASPYSGADGKLWLHWKNDGNAIGQPTYLYGSALAGDGRKLTGKAVRLLRNDATWEDHLIEAPQLVRHDEKLYMFYSANAYDRDVYAVGYAECDAPLGPCRKAAENPILKSSPAAAGPGHSFLVTTPGGQTWLLYHAWPPDSVGSVLPGRLLWLDRVDWVDGNPVVRGPTADPQPIPG